MELTTGQMGLIFAGCVLAIGAIVIVWRAGGPRRYPVPRRQTNPARRSGEVSAEPRTQHERPRAVIGWALLGPHRTSLPTAAAALLDERPEPDLVGDRISRDDGPVLLERRRVALIALHRMRVDAIPSWNAVVRGDRHPWSPRVPLLVGGDDRAGNYFGSSGRVVSSKHLPRPVQVIEDRGGHVPHRRSGGGCRLAGVEDVPGTQSRLLPDSQPDAPVVRKVSRTLARMAGGSNTGSASALRGRRLVVGPGRWRSSATADRAASAGVA